MPPRRRRRKNKSQKPPSYYNKLVYGVGAIGLAKQAIEGVRAIKKTLNPELKRQDVIINNTISSAQNSALLAFSAITQNDTAEGRDGNSLRLKHIQCKGFIRASSSSLTTMIRVFVVRDKQQVADTNPDNDMILYNNIPEAMSSVSWAKRFDVLYDRTFTLPYNTNPLQTFNFHLNPDTHVLYNGVSAGDIGKNGITIHAISNEATNVPTLYMATKTEWYDN